MCMCFWFIFRRKGIPINCFYAQRRGNYPKILLLQEHVQKLVEYMGGIFTKQLRSRVTHLVTSSVMSAKYEVSKFISVKLYRYSYHNVYFFLIDSNRYENTNSYKRMD